MGDLGTPLLQLASAVGDNLVGLRPSTVGSDAVSRETVSELSQIMCTQLVLQNFLVWGKKTSHVVFTQHRSSVSKVTVLESRGNTGGRTEVFPAHGQIQEQGHC